MGVAKIRVAAVAFQPAPATTAPNNSVFSNSQNSNVLSNKTTGGTVQPIGAVASADAFTKQKKNMTGVTILANKPVSLKPDGTIVLSDSDDVDTQQFYGITKEDILHNTFGAVALIGQNMANALDSLGFASGEEIYLDETAGGYTNDVSAFSGNNDSIIKVGLADCADGNASGVATDLVMFPEVIARP